MSGKYLLPRNTTTVLTDETNNTRTGEWKLDDNDIYFDVTNTGPTTTRRGPFQDTDQVAEALQSAIADFVSAGVAQSFTSPQKTQARSNIDALASSFTKADLNTAVSDGNVVYVGDGLNGTLGATTPSSVDYTVSRTTEITSTPTGTTQTITLNSGNHQTLSLASTSGNPTITLTVPSSSAAGTLILIQHGTTPRSITWAVSSGSILWMGGQPTWASDAVSTSRVISWRWNGSVMRLAATEVGS